jgi:hypothetical protein
LVLSYQSRYAGKFWLASGATACCCCVARATVGAVGRGAESVERYEASGEGRCNSKDRAIAVGPVLRGCPVEVPVGALQDPP